MHVIFVSWAENWLGPYNLDLELTRSASDICFIGMPRFEAMNRDFESGEISVDWRNPTFL